MQALQVSQRLFTKRQIEVRERRPQGRQAALKRGVLVLPQIDAGRPQDDAKPLAARGAPRHQQQFVLAMCRAKRENCVPRSSGSRCITNSCMAARPPADEPTPTMARRTSLMTLNGATASSCAAMLARILRSPKEGGLCGGGQDVVAGGL